MCGKLTCPSSYREFIKKLCSIAFCNHINNKYEPESYLCHSHYIVTLCILIHTPKHCHTTSLFTVDAWFMFATPQTHSRPVYYFFIRLCSRHTVCQPNQFDQHQSGNQHKIQNNKISTVGLYNWDCVCLCVCLIQVTI